MTTPTDDEDQLDALGGPVRHVDRVAPPWAREGLTVCGRPHADVRVVLSWDDARAFVARVGSGRARLLFCQTCLGSAGSRAERPGYWEEAPARITAQWAERASWRRNRDTDLVRAELLALADLVAEHREEYDQAVARRLVPDALAARRAATRRAR